ncbi:MAG: acetyl-CoA carboxylase, carboxyltransferase subunit beta [Alphaproteobacteria bacterium]
MNWIRNYVRPTLRGLVGSSKRDVPDNLWIKCPNCEQMIFSKDLEKNLKVCPKCDHHMRLNAPERIALLFDKDAFEVIETPKAPNDPLKFKDSKSYTSRIKAARSKTGRDDAIVVAKGTIGGVKAVVAAFDFDYMGGSMGIAVGEGLVQAAEIAVKEKLPFIAIPASGGARMQEGILSLMQMARSTVGVEKVKEAGLPYIVVLTDPTTGGVSASFAMLGDIHLAEKGSLIGFAGARVIEQTVRETLPEGFQRAEYLEEHGMVDRVVHRHQLKKELADILTLLMAGIQGKKVENMPKVEVIKEVVEENTAKAAAESHDIAEKKEAKSKKK